VGSLRRMTGDHPQAADLLKRALTLFRETGNRNGAVRALNELGGLFLAAGDYRGATDVLERALTISRETGPARHRTRHPFELTRTVSGIRPRPAADREITAAAILGGDSSRHPQGCSGMSVQLRVHAGCQEPGSRIRSRGSVSDGPASCARRACPRCREVCRKRSGRR
jgi:tetratricopeptide (TPR) repeat protein